jgi:hypothetical protein
LSLATIAETTTERLCDEGEDLFGISRKTIRQLHERKYPASIFPIVRVAKYLRDQLGISVMKQMRSTEFATTARMLTNPKDLPSRLCYMAFDPQHGNLMKRIKRKLGKSAGD